jgi:hypothetical protein
LSIIIEFNAKWAHAALFFLFKIEPVLKQLRKEISVVPENQIFNGGDRQFQMIVVFSECHAGSRLCLYLYLCNSANKLFSDVTFVAYLNRSYDPVMVVVKMGINEIIIPFLYGLFTGTISLFIIIWRGVVFKMRTEQNIAAITLIKYSGYWIIFYEHCGSS